MMIIECQLKIEVRKFCCLERLVAFQKRKTSRIDRQLWVRTEVHSELEVFFICPDRDHLTDCMFKFLKKKVQSIQSKTINQLRLHGFRRLKTSYQLWIRTDSWTTQVSPETTESRSVDKCMIVNERANGTQKSSFKVNESSWWSIYDHWSNLTQAGRLANISSFKLKHSAQNVGCIRHHPADVCVCAKGEQDGSVSTSRSKENFVM